MSCTSRSPSAGVSLNSNGTQDTSYGASSINLRYLGQNYEHDVPVPTGEITNAVVQEAFNSFHEMHDALYGYAMRDGIIELISFQVTALGDTEKPTLGMLRPPSAQTRPATRQVYFPGAGWLDASIAHRLSLSGIFAHLVKKRAHARSINQIRKRTR